MATTKTLALTFTLFLAACGGGTSYPPGGITGTAGGAPPPGSCAKGTGLYTIHCVSFTCADGSGSCAANDPNDVQVILQGAGLALGGSWVTDNNSFTSDGCDQEIIAHETTSNGTMSMEHLLITCNPAGDVCQETATFSFTTVANGSGSCVENSTLTKG